MDLNPSLLRPSAKLNSTNLILGSFEKLIDKYFTNFRADIKDRSEEVGSSENFNTVEFPIKGNNDIIDYDSIYRYIDYDSIIEPT